MEKMVAFCGLICIDYKAFIATQENDDAKRREVAEARARTVKKLVSEDHVCRRSFGYLNSVPKSRPIPSECMSCPDVFECLEHKEKVKK